MIKLQTGISTDRDFIKAMKERGQSVNAQFPAETLRDQLNELNEDILVSFDSTNETVLRAVNTEEPAPVDVTVRIKLTGLEEGVVATGTIGDEAITEFPASITREKDTVESLTVEAEGYKTNVSDVEFNEDKEIVIELEKEVEPIEKVTISFDVDGFEEGETPEVTIGNEVITGIPVELTEDKNTELSYTVSCEGYITQEGSLTFDEDKEVTITLEKE